MLLQGSLLSFLDKKTGKYEDLVLIRLTLKQKLLNLIKDKILLTKMHDNMVPW